MPYSLTVALAAAAVAFALTPVARALAVRVGAVDLPGPRRIHHEPVPRMGGLAMAVAVLAVAWIARSIPGPAAGLELRPLLGLTLAALPILALGMADDRWSVSPWVKLALQSCAALTLSLFGYGVPVLTNPFGPPIVTGVFNVPLTLVWVLVVTNAINLIDGLDGLAAGVVAIASASLWFVARSHQDFYVMFVASILVGACTGFLRWNFPPARVFMGDTGSQFLGLMMSAVSLLENRKGSAAVTLLLPLVALAVPLADSTVAFVRRFASGKHVFRGDTEHIHHRVLSLGLTVRSATLALWALAVFCGAIAVLLSTLPRTYAALLMTVLAAVLFVTFEGLRFVRLERERRASAPRRRS